MSLIEFDIEQKIDHLSPAIDARLSEELKAVCKMIRHLRYSAGAVTSLSRLSLILLDIIVQRAGLAGPTDQLNKFIKFCEDTPAPNGKGNLLPIEHVHGLHTIRVLSNKADHAVEAKRISVSEAEAALVIYFRVLEWYYTVCSWGPGLTSAITLENRASEIAVQNDETRSKLKPSLPPVPEPRNPFVGRDSESKTVVDLLDSDARLVTLTGSGGCGKTRLALEVTKTLYEKFSDGIAYVELAMAADESSAFVIVKQALKLEDCSNVQEVCSRIGRQSQLIILDNCEHVISFAAEFANLVLRYCESLHIIATSREPLEVEGEVTFRVPSLGMPRLDVLAAGEKAILQYDAVKLFCARAKSANADFEITSDNAPAIAELCVRLDGIPLAIELAASRVRVLPVDQILRRLSDRFSLLTTGNRSSLPRHQTLQAAIDWSYQLLSANEQSVLRRTSILRGTFNYKTASSLCLDSEMSDTCMMDALDNLIDKSLLNNISSTGDHRYHYLESVREFGYANLLQLSEEAEFTLDRLETWSITIVSVVGAALKSASVHESLVVLRAEESNLLGYIDLAIQQGRKSSVLKICTPLWRYWFITGNSELGIDLLSRALSLEDDSELTKAYVANGLRALAMLLHSKNDLPKAIDFCSQAASTADELGDPLLMGSCHGALGLLYHASALHDLALIEYEASLKSYVERSDTWGEVMIRGNIAEVMLDLGRTGDAEAVLEGIGGTSVIEDVRLRAIVYLVWARLKQLSLETESALAHLERARPILEELKHFEGLARLSEIECLILLESGESEWIRSIGLADGYRAAARSQRTPVEEGRLEDSLRKFEIKERHEEDPVYKQAFALAISS